MANVRLVVVLVSVMFVLYWGGILQATTRMTLTLLLSPFTDMRIKYVVEPPPPQEESSDYEDVGEFKDGIEEALEVNQEKVANHLMDVVNMMENLVSNSDMDSMTEVELENTFGKIYDMFPLMDTVFSKALEYEAGVSINPRTDYHETHRRYEALRKALDKKRIEKKVNVADKEEAINEDEAVEEDEEDDKFEEAEL